MSREAPIEPILSTPEGRRDAVVVERLSKRYRRTTHGIIPVPHLFASLRSTAPLATEGEDEEVEDEHETEEEEEAAPAGPLEVWALRDVSFRVLEGQGLGLIGPNGGGKTTLLKILGRITPPTRGRALLRGRVAPLIALASSLLQDARTGRDNVLLLARFFDVPLDVARARVEDVIRFAALDHVADKPVAGYSSGEKRRLAFAAVLELEPDILLADEVLSVGDAGFKQRCLERVEEARRAGLTVLFASHDFELVRRLCDRAVWLDRGEIVEIGPADEITERYERAVAGARRAQRNSPDAEADTVDLVAPRTGLGAKPQFSTPVRRVLANQAGAPMSFGTHAAIVDVKAWAAEAEADSFSAGADLRLTIALEVATPGIEIACSVVLLRNGKRFLRIVQSEAAPAREAGSYVAETVIPGSLLLPGSYRAKAGAWVVTRKGDESVLVRRRDLTFDIVGEEEPWAEPEGEPAMAELTDLAWTLSPAV